MILYYKVSSVREEKRLVQFSIPLPAAFCYKIILNCQLASILTITILNEIEMRIIIRAAGRISAHSAMLVTSLCSHSLRHLQPVCCIPSINIPLIWSRRFFAPGIVRLNLLRLHLYLAVT